MTDKIKVAIKVRPLIEREVSEGLSVQWRVRDNAIFQIDGDEKQRGEAHAFDYVFDQNVRNEDVFDVIARPIVESSVGGFNGTIFAYGQTSSGKTFTMMGGNGELGIIPLAIEYMFQTLSNIPNRQFLLRASYIEIYNEKVNDLLVKGKTSLKLREAPEGHVTITDLKEEVVTTPAKILDLMRRGEKIRRIGETNMNERSSRSHTIFRIIIESRLPNEGEEGAVQVSHLNLVDLAGSERVDQSGARGDRLKEGCAINRSLFMLSHVISQLSEGQDQYVNFRDSKLTRILQSSIGGNAHTAIICAVTPAAVEETASTLGFASRAINVKNKPQINEVLSDSALLKRYARQIAKLQDELQKAKTGKKCNEFEEIESKLQEEVRRNELLQERIDLMKEKLIGSSAKSDLDLDKKRALRRRTWCGGASRKPRLSLFPVPNLDIIDEESIVNESQESIKQSYFLCNSMHDIADSALFETPLEEFELQLINAEKRLSEESVESQEIPDSVTRRKGRHVTFAETFDGFDSTVPTLVDTSVQTDVVLVQSFLQRTFNTEVTSTPPTVLRYRVQHYQNEYDSLLEFTTLEKQVNVDYLKTLEEENSSLKQTISDAERLIVDANCTNSKLMDENKDLKQKLDCQSKKSADLTTTLLPLQDVQNSLSEKNKEVADLRKQLNTASLKISEMENMKNDFDMMLEMSERKLKNRIEELTKSLDEAWQKLQVYEQQDSAVKVRRISGVENKLDMEEWMAKHLSLEQENEKLKESLDALNLKLVNLASDVDCKLKDTEEFRINSSGIKEAKEKGNLVEVLKQQIEKLNSEKENSLQEILHLNEQYKQLNQDYSAACNELVQKERSVEKLNEQILGIHAERERDLKGYEDLKRAYEFLQQEKDSVTIELNIKNSFIIELQEKLSITEKNNFILNQLNSEEKTNVEELKKVAEEYELFKKEDEMSKNNLKQKDNYIGELNTQIEILRTEIDTKNKTLTGNENQLDSLNQQVELLNAEIKSKAKEEEDLLVKYELLRKENENNKTLLEQKEDCINEHKSVIYKLSADDDIKSKKLKESENELQSLTQQVERLNSEILKKTKEESEMKSYLEQLSQDYDAVSKEILERTQDIKDLKLEVKQLKCEVEIRSSKIQELQEQNELLKIHTVSSESTYTERDPVQDSPINNDETEKECSQITLLKLQMNSEIETCRSEIKSLKESYEVVNNNYNILNENFVKKQEEAELYRLKIEAMDLEKTTNLNIIQDLEQKLQQQNSNYETLIEKLMFNESHIKMMMAKYSTEKEADLTVINVLEEEVESLQLDLDMAVSEKNAYKKALIELENKMEAFKQQNEKNDSQKENYFKRIKELNGRCDHLSQEHKFLSEQLQEERLQQEKIKMKIEQLESEKITSLKNINELQENGEWQDQEKMVTMPEINQKNEQEEIYTHHNTLKQILHNNTSEKSVSKEKYELLNQNYLEVTEKLQEETIQLELLKSRIEELESEKEAHFHTINMYTENIKVLHEKNEQLNINLVEASSLLYQTQVQNCDSEMLMCAQELKELEQGQLKKTEIISDNSLKSSDQLEKFETEAEQLNFQKENALKVISNLTEDNTKLVKENENMKQQMEFIISEKRTCESAMQELKQREEILENELIEKSKQLDVHVQIKHQNDTAEETVLKVTYDLLNQDYLELAGKLQEAMKQLELLNSRVEKLESEKDLNAVDKFTEDIKLLQEENEQLNIKLLETNRMCDMLKVQVQEKNSEVEIILKELENQKNHCAHLMEEHKIISEKFPVTKERLEELLTEVEQLKYEKENDRKIIGELTEGNSKLVKDNKNMKEQMEFVISQRSACESAIQELKHREEVLENELVKKSEQLDLLHVQIQQQNDTAEETVLKFTYELLNQDYLELAGKLQEAMKQLKLLNSRVEKLESEKDLNAVDKFTEDIKLLQEENEQLNKKLLETSRMCDTFKIQVQEKNSEVEIIVKDLENQKNQCAHLIEENKIINEEFPVTKERLEELLTEVEQLKYEKENDRKIIGELREGNTILVKDNENMKQQMAFIISEKSACESAMQELKQREEVLENELIEKSKQLDVFHVQIQQQNDTAEETVLKVTYDLLNQDYLELARKLQEGTKQLELLKSRVKELESEKEVDLNAVDKFPKDIKLLGEEDELLETIRLNESCKLQVQEKNSEIEMIVEEQKNHSAHLKEEHKIVTEKLPVLVTSEQLRVMNAEVDQLKYQKENDSEVITKLKEDNSQLAKDNEHLKQQLELITSEKSAFESNMKELKHREELLNNERVEESRQLDVLQAQIQQGNVTEEKIIPKPDLVLDDKLQEGTIQLELLKARVEELESEKEVNLNIVDKFTEDIKLLQEENERLNIKLLETNKLCDIFKLEVQERNSELEIKVKQLNEEKVQFELSNEGLKVVNEQLLLKQKQLIEVLTTKVEQLKSQEENDKQLVNKLTEDNSNLVKDIENMKHQMEFIVSAKSACESTLQELKQREEVLKNELVEKNRQMDMLQVQMQQQTDPAEETVSKESYEISNKNYLILDGNLKKETIQVGLLQSRVGELESENEVNLNTIYKLTENIKVLQEENEKLNTKLVETSRLCDTFNVQLQEKNYEVEMKVKQLKEVNSSYELSNEELKIVNEKFLVTSEHLEELKTEIEQLKYQKENDNKLISKLTEVNSAELEKANRTLFELKVVNEKLLLKQELIEELMTKVEQLKSQEENDKQFINKLTEDNSNLVKDIENMKHQMEFIVSAKSACESTLQELKQREEVLKNELVEKNRQMDMLQVQMQQQTDPAEETVSKESYEILNKNYLILDGNLKKETIQVGLLQSRVGELESENEVNLNTIYKLTENIKVLQEENEKLNTKLMETSRLCDTFNVQLQEKNYEVEMKVKQLKEVNSSYELSNEELKIVNEKFLVTSEHLEELKTEIEQLKYQKENDNKLISKLTEVNSAELEKANRTLFEKRRELESCRSMIVKEILSLSLEADKKTITEYKLTDLVSKLLGLIMEKEKELIEQLQQQLQNECAEKEDIARNSAEKERRNEAWIKELESDNERLQADLSKLESEKKNLGNHGKINALEEEKFQLVKSLRDAETSIVVLQRDMKRVVSDNTNSVKKLKDLQILNKEKDDEISALQNKVEEQIQNLRELTNMVEVRNKEIRQKEVVIVELKEQIQKFVTQETESQFTGQQKQNLEKEIENLKSDNSNLLELLDNKLRELAEREASSSVLREELNNAKVYQQQLEAFEKEISCLKSKNTQLAELLEIKVNELKQKDASFSQIEEELIRKNMDLELKLRNLNDTHLNLEEMYKKDAEDIIQKDATICQLQVELKESKKLEIRYQDSNLQLQSTEKELIYWKDNSNQLIEENKELNHNLNLEREKSQEATDKLAKITIDMEQTLEVFHGKISDFEHMLNEEKLKKEELQNEMKDLFNNNVRLDAEAKTYKSQINELNAAIMKEREQYSATISDLKNISDELEKVRAQERKLTEVKKAISDRLCTKENHCLKLEKELSKMMTVKDERDRLLHKCELLNKEHTEVTNHIIELIKLLEQYLQQSSSVSSNIDSISDSFMKISQYVQQLGCENMKLRNSANTQGIKCSSAIPTEIQCLRTELQQALDEKNALDEENEMMLAKIRGLEKMNTSLYHKISSCEEEIKDTEKELDTALKKADSMTKENENLTVELGNMRRQLLSRIRELEAENEDLKDRNKQLLKEREGATHHDRLCTQENHCLKLEKELSKIMTVKDERDRLLHKCELLNKEHTEVTNHIIELIKLLELYLQQSSSVSSNIDNFSDSFLKISQYVQQLGCENMKLRNSANTQGMKCSSAIPTEIESLRTELQQAFEEKTALDEENEMMLTRIRGLEKMNTSLYHRISSREEEIKDTEEELDTALKKVDSVTKENENLTVELGNMRRQLLLRIRELEAENEDLKDRNNQLLKESEGATHFIQELTAKCAKLELGCKKVRPTSSVATLTEASGDCIQLAEKLEQAKQAILERNMKITTLELQIKTEEFPFQEKVKDLESVVSSYKSRNMELKSELRRLQLHIEDSRKNCEKCNRHELKVLKEVSIQTDDECDHLMEYGGSGLIREDMLIKMRKKNNDQEKKIEFLKKECRARRNQVINLKENLEKHLNSCLCHSGSNSEVLEEEKTEHENASSHAGRNSEEPSKDVHTQTENSAEKLSLRQNDVREDVLHKMTVKINDLEKDNGMLRSMCRERRVKIIELENKLSRFTPCTNVEQQESQRVKKLYSAGVLPGHRTGLVRHPLSVNKENEPISGAFERHAGHPGPHYLLHRGPNNGTKETRQSPP